MILVMTLIMIVAYLLSVADAFRYKSKIIKLIKTQTDIEVPVFKTTHLFIPFMDMSMCFAYNQLKVLINK